MARSAKAATAAAEEEEAEYDPLGEQYGGAADAQERPPPGKRLALKSRSLVDGLGGGGSSLSTSGGLLS